MLPRYFTLDEVNRLIPRLEELVSELREAHHRMAALERQLGQTVRQRSGGNGFHLAREEQARTLQGEAEAAVARFQRLSQEVADLGGEIKDLDRGLVDFRALRQGREVYLCWQLGEPECAWWHDLEAGFRGRQPLNGV